MNNPALQNFYLPRFVSHKPWRRNRGFNLIEIIVTIAIVGVLSTVALPAYTGLITRMKAKTTASDLYMALIKTRSEAIKRNASVTLAVSSGGWKIYPSAAEDMVLEDRTINGEVTISGSDSAEYNSSGRIAGVVSFGVKAEKGSESSERCVSTSLSGMPKVKDSAC